jgi:RecA-family ATPase
VSVATGGKLWGFSAERGDVLYLVLEDNHPRLQDRLNKIKAASVDISRLKLSTATTAKAEQPGIRQSLISESEKGQSLPAQFVLSWTHYLILMRIKDADARCFYEIEAASQQ